MLELIAVIAVIAIATLAAWGFTFLGVLFWPVFVAFAVCGLIGLVVGLLV